MWTAYYALARTRFTTIVPLPYKSWRCALFPPLDCLFARQPSRPADALPQHQRTNVLLDAALNFWLLFTFRAHFATDRVMDASPGNRPSQPPVSPTDQPTYIRCDGQVISHKQFYHTFGPIIQGNFAGQPQRLDLLQEAQWMLAQHSPNHPAFKGQKIGIPLQTTPFALKRLGIPEPAIQAWIQRRDGLLQQQQQQRTQQAPQSMVPNMIPSAPQVQAQQASPYAGSPSQLSNGQRMPPGISYSPHVMPQSPARIDQRMAKASSLNRLPRTAPQDGMVPRMPSATSPQSPSARPQYQTSPGRPQDMLRPSGAPNGAGQYMWPNSRNLPPHPSPSPTMGMFPPPLSRSNSSHSEAPRSKAPFSDAEKVKAMNNWLQRWLAKAHKSHPPMFAWALERLGDNPDFGTKLDLYNRVQANAMRAYAEAKAKAQQEQAQQTRSQQPQEVIDLASNKRKDHPTASSQPPKRRQVIDLTQPRREQLSNHEPQAPVLLDAPGGDKIGVIPVPELAATDDLQAHATIFGVDAHDVELNDPIFTRVQNSAPAPLPVPDRPARPHVNLVPAPKIHPDQDITIWIPDPEVAAAKAKIESKGYDVTWSNGDLDHVEPVSTELLEVMGCKEEEDGLWRAPPYVTSEEKANVDWTMLSSRSETSFAP